MIRQGIMTWPTYRPAAFSPESRRNSSVFKRRIFRLLSVPTKVPMKARLSSVIIRRVSRRMLLRFWIASLSRIAIWVFYYKGEKTVVRVKRHEPVREQHRVDYARPTSFPEYPQVLRHPTHLQRTQKPPYHRMAHRQGFQRKVRALSQGRYGEGGR